MFKHRPTPHISFPLSVHGYLKGQFIEISLYDVYRRGDSGGSCLCGRPVVLGSLLLLWLFGLSVALIVVSVKYRKYRDGQFYVAKKEEGVWPKRAREGTPQNRIISGIRGDPLPKLLDIRGLMGNTAKIASQNVKPMQQKCSHQSGGALWRVILNCIYLYCNWLLTFQ